MKKKNNIFKIIFVLIIILALASFIGININQYINEKEIEKVIEEDINNNEIEDIPESILSGATNLDEEGLEVEGFDESIPETPIGATKEDIPIGATQSQGSIVYYSQIDGRWKNKPYTICGNPSQTIGSSGCGPTSAAMIVAGLRDSSVTPETMANLYVNNGFRTKNNGTYASAFSWTAKRWNIDFKQVYSVNDMINLVSNGYYCVVSCSNGLFTTGGHYIVVYEVSGNTLKIYDPYVYTNKFNSYGRSGKVTLSGNTVYCSISNFKAYANSKGYYGFKKDSQPSSNPTTTYTQGQRVLVNDPIAVAYDGGAADILVDNTLNQFWINRSVVINNSIYGLATVVWDEGQRDLVQIFDTQFWVPSNTLSTNIPSSNPTTTTTSTTVTPTKTYVLGKYKTNTRLNVRKSPNTSSTILKTYNTGTRFDTIEIKNGWARTPSGWVKLSYCTLVYRY